MEESSQTKKDLEEQTSSGAIPASPINENLYAEVEEDSQTLKAVARRDVLKMRKQWSYVLLALIASIVFYDLWFSTALGRGWIVFADTNLISYFILENLAKIAGLAYIVVNFLFDRTKDHF